MTSADSNTLSSEPYVLLTTFRASGEPVGTPVWVVDGLGGMLVTTSGDSGKVKRIRKNPTVELVACDVRGTVPADAVPLKGLATVLDDADSRAAIDSALEEKYGLRYKAIRAAGKLRRSTAANSVVVRIVPAA